MSAKEKTKMAKTPMCKECKDGEIYDEPAVWKVRHPNYDTWRENAPPITKWVCEHHVTMLGDDYGDELQFIEKAKGQ
jgi:hypothetical protein